MLIEFDEQVLAVLTEARLRQASDVEVVVGYEQPPLDRQGWRYDDYCESFPEREFSIYR